MREVFVGRVDTDPGWTRVLDQERIAHTSEGALSAPVVVLTGAVPDWVADFVESGGVAVVSGAVAGESLLPMSFSASVTGFLPPGRSTRAYAPSLVTMFECEGGGELRLHEDRVVKYDLDPDRFPAVFTIHRGRGALVVSGIPLTALLVAPGDRLRAFCDYSPMTERVASVDKATIADTLLGMVRAAFQLAGLPWVTMDRFPQGASSVFIFRVDVDGVYGENTRRLAQEAARQQLPASFFLNGDYSHHHPGALDGWSEDMEIGQHAWLHTLMGTRDDNRENLRRAEQWMRESVGRVPTSFVAPRGLWNRALGEALRDLDYRYSSDFGLDFDSLPFRSDGDVLQVPVHPYSPERATVWAEEVGRPAPSPDDVRRHYLSAVSTQVRRGLPAHVYGHPEVLGRMADHVLPSISALADELALPRMTLGDYADFWIRRECITPSVRLDQTTGELAIDVPPGDPDVLVESHVPLHVTLNGHDEGTITTQRRLRV